MVTFLQVEQKPIFKLFGCIATFSCTKKDANLDEIVILASEDTHYSIPKGANLLQLDWLKIPVSLENREIDTIALEEIIVKAKNNGKKYFIVVSNMGTTMFSSVDNPEDYISVLENTI